MKSRRGPGGCFEQCSRAQPSFIQIQTKARIPAGFLPPTLAAMLYPDCARSFLSSPYCERGAARNGRGEAGAHWGNNRFAIVRRSWKPGSREWMRHFSKRQVVERGIESSPQSPPTKFPVRGTRPTTGAACLAARRRGPHPRVHAAHRVHAYFRVQRPFPAVTHLDGGYCRNSAATTLWKFHPHQRACAQRIARSRCKAS